MSEETKMFVVILMVIVALSLGWCIGHMTGYQEGIAYQTTQPVHIEVIGYSVDTPITLFNSTMMPEEQYVRVLAYTESNKNQKINNYRIRVIP